ncbi:MAG: DUF1849 family protein [Alphaproteobacteria bacterium]
MTMRKCFKVSLMAASLVFMASGAQAGGIASHKAFYEMSLDDREQKSNIVNILGRSAVTVERDCEGWISVEDYVIEFVSENGGSERILSHFESWEAKSGDKFSFDVNEESTFEGRKDYGGFASLEPDAQAVFSNGAGQSLDLPKDVYFPMRHMEAVLSAADQGKPILAATVFFGGDYDDALMKTNTVVGNWQEQSSDIDFGDLSANGYWPVQIAYFKQSATNGEPEYEISFRVQPNGVVRQYVIDYGDFSIAAELTRIDGVDDPVCK